MLQLLLLLALTSSISSQSIRYQWNYFNYTWPSIDEYNEAVENGTYIPANNAFTGIKVWKDHLYLSIPRWKNGVPATLISIPTKPINGNLSPLLKPYPTWAMQKIDDCKAFQFVQSMEIDPSGRMWILDNGRTEFQTDNPKTKCPPRLVILDLENDGKILLDFKFPEEVAHNATVFLNDLVVDHEDGGWVYITDSDSLYPGIIVFSLEYKTSWKITDDSMKSSDDASQFLVNGTQFTTKSPVNGIALSGASTEGDRILYYSALSSYKTYCIPVNILKNCLIYSISENVSVVAEKSSQTSGMIISAPGTLYFALLTENAVIKWNPTALPFDSNYRIVYQNEDTNQWPDSYGIDEESQLWWNSNRIQNFMTNNVDINVTNYRIFVEKIDGKSYQYYKDGSAPTLPKISS